MPPSLTSSSNQLFLVLTTDASGNGTGFYAEYTSTSPQWCSGMTQFTEPSATFNDGSGNFYYQGGATCMFRVKPTDANNITLYFNSFETEEGMDKVKVYDNSTLVGEFSGNTIPDPIVITSGTLFITWSTNQVNNFQGWEAYYEIDNVGISETSGIENIETYPNPATETLILSFNMEEKSNISIKLINLTGQVLYDEAQAGFTGTYFTEIGVNSFPAGIYFLEIASETGKSVKKIMVR